MDYSFPKGPMDKKEPIGSFLTPKKQEKIDLLEGEWEKLDVSGSNIAKEKKGASKGVGIYLSLIH
ncbi:MAG: hypothetical protein P0S93_02280, partial [Candidatus Neptunochlamydia sp.]|nr:hypothetical protein [Candidatus Neptunochlamydia sp.]